MAQLLKISLLYDDGTILSVREKKTLEIGTKFMDVIKDQDVKWEMTKQKGTIVSKIVKFFSF